ncbi:MAG: PIN domain-containing protein [Phycisphaeraceae bacterium]|nr:MAG: PIN domain-containing protein [Phycisphaeraceae bacterium]
MTALVVDASVLAKLYFPEQDSEVAEREMRKHAEHLIAPELLWLELASVAWKKVQRSQISGSLAQRVLSEAMQMPIRSMPILDYIDGATKIALETGRTVYDSLYLAVAVAEKGVVLTADERMVNALSEGPFGSHVRLLGR